MQTIRTHLVHFGVTLGALLLGIMLLVQYSTITDSRLWHGAFYLGLVAILVVLVIEWRTIISYIRVQKQSLAFVEHKHPYMPSARQMLLTILLTILFTPLVVDAQDALRSDLGKGNQWNCMQVGTDPDTAAPQLKCHKGA